MPQNTGPGGIPGFPKKLARCAAVLHDNLANQNIRDKRDTGKIPPNVWTSDLEDELVGSIDVQSDGANNLFVVQASRQSGLRDGSTTELTGLTMKAATASRQPPAQASMRFLAMQGRC